MEGTTVGIDLAKNVFHLCAVDGRGRIRWRKRTTRQGLGELLAKLPPSAVAMESCAGSHYWARRCREHGHVARLINGKFVKPFVKSQKNDANDAEAVCEAISRPSMRYVPIKTAEQQDLQAMHRIRDTLMRHRKAKANQIRGLVGEYGIVAPKTIVPLRRAIPDWLEDAENMPDLVPMSG